MKVQVNFTIYILVDCQGNSESVVANESNDIVQICGMKNYDNDSIYFESEAYHLNKWCKDFDIQLFELHRTEPIEVQLEKEKDNA